MLLILILYYKVKLATQRSNGSDVHSDSAHQPTEAKWVTVIINLTQKFKVGSSGT